MPKDVSPRPHDSGELRSSIQRLSALSEQLRKAAKINAGEAEAISRRVRELELRVAESEGRKKKKTCGRIS